MFSFNRITLQALEATATTSAAYLDACDSGAKFCQLDPAYYKACGNVLVRIFALVDPDKAFPDLVEHSAAAREVAIAKQITHRIEVSRLGFYPQLALLLNRVAA
ncbi:hypothetical protein [Dechloromonas sp. A34]|uniref:hypothetical protein n=1 Tax=Dechloromonas sp. A34 TaxID=447588 RepID=UPI002249544D|nr:hypothetical protein [Dechloromonas sp. A34]